MSHCEWPQIQVHSEFFCIEWFALITAENRFVYLSYRENRLLCKNRTNFVWPAPEFIPLPNKFSFFLLLSFIKSTEKKRSKKMCIRSICYWIIEWILFVLQKVQSEFEFVVSFQKRKKSEFKAIEDKIRKSWTIRAVQLLLILG